MADPSASREYDELRGTGSRQSSLPVAKDTQRTGATDASGEPIETPRPRRDPQTTLTRPASSVALSSIQTVFVPLMTSGNS